MSLKLEVGKTYEMNDGQREHVVAYVPVNPITGKPNPRPYVAMSAGSEVYRYREDGAFFADGVPTSYDLVREHVPPPTLLDLTKEIEGIWPGPPDLYTSENIRRLKRMARAAADAANAS